MRAVYTFVLLAFLAMHCYGQQFAVAVDGPSIMYVGLSNHITLIVENMPCKDLIAETNNGTILQKDNPCQYDVLPAMPGRTIIKIYNKSNKKLTEETEFKTMTVPKPQASIQGHIRGIIRKTYLQAQLRPTIDFVDFDINVRFPLNSFKVSIIRNSTIIFEKFCQCSSFDDDMKKAISNTKAGDMFRCTDISFSGLGYNKELTNSIELQVID